MRMVDKMYRYIYIYRYSCYYTTKLQQKNKKTVQEVICMSLKAIPNLPVIESFPKIPGENFNTGINLVKKLSFKISWNHPICCWWKNSGLTKYLKPRQPWEILYINGLAGFLLLCLGASWAIYAQIQVPAHFTVLKQPEKGVSMDFVEALTYRLSLWLW